MTFRRMSGLAGLTALMLIAARAETRPSPPEPASAAAAVSVSIVSGASALTTAAFSPNPVNVTVGTTITWTNNDFTTHTSTATGGAWSSPPMAPGGQFSVTLNTPGTFPYLCTIHPNMVGTVNVAACSVALAPSTLPVPTLGVPYTQTLTGSGGTAPYTFTVTTGALPPGLSLSAAGALSGTPTTAGSFSFAVRATDAGGCFGEQTYTLTLASPVPVMPGVVFLVFALGLAAMVWIQRVH